MNDVKKQNFESVETVKGFEELEFEEGKVRKKIKPDERPVVGDPQDSK